MKKIKKKRNPSEEIQDPNLDEIDENRAFEIECDEETNEIIFVHHYRRKWGDGFDADVEHGLTLDETAEMIGIVIGYMELLKAKALIEKTVPTVEEGNPMQGPKKMDVE